MAEYLEPEDCDDLLEGSDEDDEEVEQANNYNELLDLNELEDVGVGTTSAGDNPIFLDMLQPIGDSDDDEEDEEGRLAKEEKKKADDMARRDKMAKMLNMVAPGIDLFPTPPDEEGNGFLFFSQDSLDLETDMGYTRRAKLLGHGFTSTQLDTIMSDRLQFVRHLMPEAQSVLICDKTDFRAVMNFLFYSISVCTDRSLNDLLTKAFFDLRKNYGFRWNLSLKHIMAVLLNYGVEELAVLNTRFYNKENVGLVKHLEEVRKTGQEAGEKYQLPKLPVFLHKRKYSAKKMFLAQSDQKFHFCVSRFILLVSEFSAGLPSHLEFRYRNNWSEQIIFMHVLLLLGTDKRFIMDHRVKESITSALHYHMDSFSSSQWFWGPANRPANDQSKQDGFNHSNVHKSLIRMVNEFFPGELCPSVMTWDQGNMSNLKMTNLDGTSDHHLNMLHRIHLVPPSFRGNQVRKYLAFMYLQTLAEISFSLPTHVDVVDLVDSPDLCDKLSDGLKMIVLSKNYELIMTLVELYDIIVGHEPEIDFTLDKVEHINRVKKGVLGWVQKKLPGIGRGVDINNEQSIKAMQLAEYLDIVEGRWQTYCNRHS
eukprot:TRINITY_DN14529_c0_g1_i1.p1 TRINITY_DN14529_c0_g1~~TRINITY_DN14529_c0_g1_i1.p1  ORF type:complete len:593 (-),score=251.90 TRINITY_DN14529_c0_g1_i1:76-1854(-)